MAVLGRYRVANLPDRVRAAIARQQEASEIVIGWAQLGVVAVFGALYTLAPKTFSPDSMLVPVPWALGAYIAFTLVRLALAYLRRLPDWLLFVSVVVDIALLLGLIFSFHIQYEQPASFYLKVPTLLYVFIFIALRALRYEARFVLLSGLVASLGWLGMVWYATVVDTSDPMITKNYVEYLTSNSVLIGAEFDKVVSILVVTAILALGIWRSRGLLVTSVVERTRAHDLSPFVPEEVARRLARSEQGALAGAAEIKEATVIFVDLEGFTAISEGLSPEGVIDVLNDYFNEISLPLVRRGGVITQFQGDAVLASFNVPRPDPDHARNAVLAALDIQAAVQRRTFGEGLKLRARVGINTGLIVGGLVGTPDRLSYTVHGDAVNLAARLEALNKDYGTQILVSERTCELAGGEFPFRAIGQTAVRGKREPVRVFSL